LTLFKNGIILTILIVFFLDFCYTVGNKRYTALKFGRFAVYREINSVEIIAQNKIENNLNNLKGYWLHFYLNGEGGEFLDYNLPIPTYLEHYNKGYAVAWCIEGYFGTKKGEAFLNDVIARFIISFADLSPKRLPYKPEVKKDNKTAHILNKAYSLKRFSTRLKSIKTKNKIPQRAESFEDLIFWAIKLMAEDLITQYGIIPYQQLEDFALNNFLHKKDRSTIRAKCRNIFNWYEQRDFKITKKKEWKMSRTDHIKAVHKKRTEETERKILNYTSGLFSETLKKKNGKWNISKISKDLNLSVNTVKKYL